MTTNQTMITYTLEVHEEDGQFWGQVVELPGCFVAGDSLDELMESLDEAVAMCLTEADVEAFKAAGNAWSIAPVVDLNDRRSVKTHARARSMQVDVLAVCGR